MLSFYRLSDQSVLKSLALSGKMDSGQTFPETVKHFWLKINKSVVSTYNLVISVL